MSARPEIKPSYSTVELAALYGCGRWRMWQILRSHGLVKRGRRRIPLSELLAVPAFKDAFDSMMRAWALNNSLR